APVARATITNQVNSSGAVSAGASQNLGFAKGGRLTSLKVEVGDHVVAGQVLAKIDTYAARQVLKQQRANLAAQQAALDRIIANPAVSGARATLTQSRVILTATRRQVSAVSTADDSAITRARAQLRAARTAKQKANDALDAARDACNVPDPPPAARTPPPTSAGRTPPPTSAARTPPPTSAAPTPPPTSAAPTPPPTSAAPTPPATPSTCGVQVAMASSAQASAEQGVEAAKTTLAAAEQEKKVDAAAGQVSVETSRQSVVTAQNALNSASSDRPHAIDQQLALVDAAEALVRSAQKDVDDGTLTAPADGVISAINGVVGEYLSPSSGTTALAPGSHAAIPGSASAGGAAGAAATGTTATRPGGSQFVVLSSVKGFQAVIPFEESDAAKIAPEQLVSVSFDAIPGLIESGTVVSVAPSATAIAGVISYYVTIDLEDADSRLRDGQTARAEVITAERTNVLSVPNAAVRRQGDTDTVVVVDPDGRQRVVTFQPGLVGADRTEVLSGLSEGQRVVVSPGG
ncbi:MAG TPA: biotin/lipoyl-binding protein, partial [Propionibacteriaceae bacterium]|nr:biotin/lipoyl-binding protein [Propionibacteriaceae bacterium]